MPVLERVKNKKLYCCYCTGAAVVDTQSGDVVCLECGEILRRATLDELNEYRQLIEELTTP